MAALLSHDRSPAIIQQMAQSTNQACIAALRKFVIASPVSIFCLTSGATTKWLGQCRVLTVTKFTVNQQITRNEEPCDSNTKYLHKVVMAEK